VEPRDGIDPDRGELAGVAGAGIKIAGKVSEATVKRD
jgi:hypothetical protein